MLSNRDWVTRESSYGYTAPAYGYARNNPLSFVDPDGKAVPLAIPIILCAGGWMQGSSSGRRSRRYCAAKISNAIKERECDEYCINYAGGLSGAPFWLCRRCCLGRISGPACGQFGF